MAVTVDIIWCEVDEGERVVGEKVTNTTRITASGVSQQTSAACPYIAPAATAVVVVQGEVGDAGIWLNFAGAAATGTGFFVPIGSRETFAVQRGTHGAVIAA